MRPYSEKEERMRQKLIDHQLDMQAAFDHILASGRHAHNVTIGIQCLISSGMPKDMALMVDREKKEVVGVVRDIGINGGDV